MVVVTHEHRVDAELAEHRGELLAALNDVAVDVVVGHGVGGVVEARDLPGGVGVCGDGLLHEGLVLSGARVVGVERHEQHAVVGEPVVAALRARALGRSQAGDVRVDEVIAVAAVGSGVVALVVVADLVGGGHGAQGIRGEVGIVLGVGLVAVVVVDLVAHGEQEVGAAELLLGRGHHVVPALGIGAGVAGGADLRVAGHEEAEVGAGTKRAGREGVGVGPGVVVAHTIDVGGVGGQARDRGLVGVKALALRCGLGGLNGLDARGVRRERVAGLIALRGDNVLDARLVGRSAEPAETALGLRGADAQEDILDLGLRRRGGIGRAGAVHNPEALHVEVDVRARRAAVVDLDGEHVVRGLKAKIGNVVVADGARARGAIVRAAVVVGAVDGVGAVLDVVVELADDVAVDCHDGGIVIGDLTGDLGDGGGVCHVKGGAEIVDGNVVAVIGAAHDVLVEQVLRGVAAAEIGDLAVLCTEAAGGRLPGGVGHGLGGRPVGPRADVVVAILPVRGPGLYHLGGRGGAGIDVGGVRRTDNAGRGKRRDDHQRDAHHCEQSTPERAFTCGSLLHSNLRFSANVIGSIWFPGDITSHRYGMAPTLRIP